MSDSSLIDAKSMLDSLLKTQPGLIRDVVTSKGSGESVADFCAAFIRQYSEHLEHMAQAPSRE